MKYWYWPETHAIAATHRLDPNLVVAVAIVESSGHTNAYRYEPAFFAKYLANRLEWRDENPRRISASYGILQVLYVTARELGYPRNEPPEGLFVPTCGLEYGCRALADRMAWAKGDLRKALAGYNGGKGNWEGVLPQAYADRVLMHLAKVQAGDVEW